MRLAMTHQHLTGLVKSVWAQLNMPAYGSLIQGGSLVFFTSRAGMARHRRGAGDRHGTSGGRWGRASAASHWRFRRAPLHF